MLSSSGLTSSSWRVSLGDDFRSGHCPEPDKWLDKAQIPADGQAMKTLIGGMLTALVLLTASLQAVPAHAADPDLTVDPASNSRSHYWDTWHYRHVPSDTGIYYILLARSTWAANDANVLDYRIAVSHFGTHTQWRRGFAAGWMGYHSVDHISATERAKVVALARAANTDRFTADPTSLLEPTPLNGCTGASKTVNHAISGRPSGYEVWSYWNSCQTNRWVRTTTFNLTIQCGLTAGVLGVTAGGLVTAAFGVICTSLITATTNRVVNAQDYSGSHAVIIKTRTPGKWFGLYKVAPQ